MQVTHACRTPRLKILRAQNKLELKCSAARAVERVAASAKKSYAFLLQVRKDTFNKPSSIGRTSFYYAAYSCEDFIAVFFRIAALNLP